MEKALELLYLVGRVLFSSIFLMSGLAHFTKRAMMVQYAQSKGAAAPSLLVPLTGLMILAGGLSVLLGLSMEIGAWLLVFFLVPTAFIMHAPWKVADPMEKANQQAHFMKNLVMAGGALILYCFVQQAGYGPFTLGEPMG
jgi:putative oxidoreductase